MSYLERFARRLLRGRYAYPKHPPCARCGYADEPTHPCDDCKRVLCWQHAHDDESGWRCAGTMDYEYAHLGLSGCPELEEMEP